MNRFNKYVAIGTAVVAGPLLATTAVAVRDYVASNKSSEDDPLPLDSVFVSPNSGDCPGDICVDYYPPWTQCQTGDHWCFDTRTGGGGGNGGGGGGGGGCDSNDPYRCDDPGSPPPPTDCDQGDIDDHGLARADPSLQPLLFRLSEQYRLALGRLGSLPADSKFIYPDGSSVTTVELYRLLSRADFDVHREPVPYSPGVANWDGRYGHVVPNNGNPVYFTEVSWMQANLGTENNAQWWVFHELSHLTQEGQADWAQYSTPNSLGGTAMTPAEWEVGERFANALQFAIRTALNDPPLTNGPGVQSAAPRYDPGSGSSAPTVAQAEATCPAP